MNYEFDRVAPGPHQQSWNWLAPCTFLCHPPHQALLCTSPMISSKDNTQSAHNRQEEWCAKYSIYISLKYHSFIRKVMQPYVKEFGQITWMYCSLYLKVQFSKMASSFNSEGFMTNEAHVHRGGYVDMLTRWHVHVSALARWCIGVSAHR